MKILSIAAGAGGMYCGSCLRDNALAVELLARGHDVTLLPLYTPLLTDETNVSRPQVLFGGISVYLQQRSPMFRHMPAFVDRLLDAPGFIKAFADRSVSTDARLLGDLTISMLEGASGVLRKEFDKLIAWTSTEPAPDVVNITNSMLIGLAQPLRAAFHKPVCCTLQGEDLFLGNLVEPYRTTALDLIRAQVSHVDRFVAVSDYYAAFMARHLRIPEGRISVVPLGINLTAFDDRGPDLDDRRPDLGDRRPDLGDRRPDLQVGRKHDDFKVGYLARIAPEKGLHVLAEAYLRFRQRTHDARVRLDVAGYMAASEKPYLERVRAVLHRGGRSGEFTYHGVVDRTEKASFLRGLDVLSVPATYDEPKGFSLLEAMACGVPVVQPRRGAFTEIVERTGGGLFTRPDDPESLADGLYQMWKDAGLRARLGRAGREGVRAHYSIQHSADRLMNVYEELARPS